MSITDTFSYHFFPVGQGLFSAGAIHRSNENVPSFLWVYDCGTSSANRLVDRGLDRLKDFAEPRVRIDLLILSHFDRDHINGVIRLLQKFKIGTLLLPYMPLAQRLIIAYEEGSGGVGDPMTAFYLNPVTFLRTQEGVLGIDHILFIPPSGNAGPQYPGEDQGEPGPDDEPVITFNPDKQPYSEDKEMLVQAGAKKYPSVEFLQPGSPIRLAAYLWEFIPYNDDPHVEITDDFIKLVESEQNNLLSVTTNTARDASLKKLKKTYEDYFGSESEEKNAISLFLYCGPIYQPRAIYGLSGISRCHGCIAGCIEDCDQPCTHCTYMYHMRKTDCSRCSILYSGDGYLDTPDRLTAVIKYLDERRVQRIGVFQVMHHGAESNWHQGTANAIAPVFSVFSSNPEHKKYKHPHALVLRDFWRYGAVQVDKNVGFEATGDLHRESTVKSATVESANNSTFYKSKI